METPAHKIALLIDADNTSSKIIGEIISEAGRHGKVTIRRAYGDFSTEHLKNWKEQLNTYAIRPMQKFSYSTGKNSTDSALIIDAMDIMHTKLVSGFCIASSDSDYTGLALRLREEGLFVLGIGRFNTPEAFQKSCEIFVFTENLVQQKTIEEKIIEKETKNVQEEKPLGTKSPKLKGLTVIGKIDLAKVVSKIDKKPLDTSIIDRAVKMAIEENGVAYLGTIGEKIRTLDPSFDSRTYGFGSMTTLFKSMPDKYELVYKNNGSSLYIKPKYLSV